MLRLLLTSSKSDLTLTIENLIVKFDNLLILLATKELKCVSLLFLLKWHVCSLPLLAEFLNFPRPSSLTSLVSIVRHLFSLRLFSIQLKILIRQTFLIGNFCSDSLVHFPFGAQIIFSFELYLALYLLS